MTKRPSRTLVRGFRDREEAEAYLKFLQHCYPDDCQFLLVSGTGRYAWEVTRCGRFKSLSGRKALDDHFDYFWNFFKS